LRQASHASNTAESLMIPGLPDLIFPTSDVLIRDYYPNLY